MDALIEAARITRGISWLCVGIVLFRPAVRAWFRSQIVRPFDRVWFVVWAAAVLHSINLMRWFMGFHYEPVSAGDAITVLGLHTMWTMIAVAIVHQHARLEGRWL